jgi:DNA-binding XRE family transcriptional regulator
LNKQVLSKFFGHRLKGWIKIFHVEIKIYLCNIKNMSKESETHVAPFEVVQSMQALGAHLARTRLARGDTQKLAAERCGLHMQTVARIERGDLGVAIGNVFTLMHIYGQSERMFELSRTDKATEILYNFHLPKRGRAASRIEG